MSEEFKVDSENIKRDAHGRWQKGTPAPGPGRRAGKKRTLRSDCYYRLTEEERQQMIAQQFEAARKDPKHGLDFLRWLEGPSPRDSKYDQPEDEGDSWYVDRESWIKVLQARITRLSARGTACFGVSYQQGEVEAPMAPGGIECETNGHSNGRHKAVNGDDATAAREE